MKKFLVFFVLFCLFSSFCFSQTSGNVTVIIEVTNVVVNNGKVLLAIFSNAEEFRKEEPFLAFDLGSSSTVLSKEIQLPPGEYVLSAIQDTNGNNKLDFRLLIPTELVAISNYNGRGFPSRDFNRQKIPINQTTGKVTIALYKF